MNILSQYKGLRKENYVLCFGRMVTAMGSLVWPMLTMILNQKMGMRADHIAWIIAVVGALSMPVNLIGGRIADSFDKKMNIIYLDMVSVTCYIICASIPLSAISIVLMFIASACQNMEQPSYSAIIADISFLKDRERAYSLQYLGGNLGFVLSPMLAGFLFQNYLWLAFLISAASIGSSSLLIFFLVKDITPVKDTVQNAKYQTERRGEGLWTVIKKNKIILLYILAVSGYYAGYQIYNYMMPLDLARVHGGSGAVIFGSISSVNCIVVVIFTAHKNVSENYRDGKNDIGTGPSFNGLYNFPAFSGADTVLLFGHGYSDLGRDIYCSCGRPLSGKQDAGQSQREDTRTGRCYPDGYCQRLSIFGGIHIPDCVILCRLDCGYCNRRIFLTALYSFGNKRPEGI